MTWGNPLWWDTCSRPSRDLGIVTHLLGCPGQLRALSSSSMAPFFFFNFFTKESTAFSAHFSSSSPCFQPSSLFTAGLVKEKRELMGVLECIRGELQVSSAKRTWTDSPLLPAGPEGSMQGSMQGCHRYKLCRDVTGTNSAGLSQVETLQGCHRSSFSSGSNWLIQAGNRVDFLLGPRIGWPSLKNKKKTLQSA